MMGVLSLFPLRLIRSLPLGWRATLALVSVCAYTCNMQQMRDANNGSPQASPGAPSAEELAAQTLETAPLLMRAIRALMRAGRAADLSTPQFRALGYVGRHPGASLSHVAEHLGLSTPATSRLIDILVKRGLVERGVAPDDRRYVTLHLTAHGEAIFEETRRRALLGLSARLEGLSPTEREVVARALPILRALFTQETESLP